MESWIPWIASWYPVPPLSRRTREVIITLLYNQPLEFRIAFLNYQIRKMYSEIP